MMEEDPRKLLVEPAHQPGHPGEELGPVRASERLPIIDALRGFALFGILIVNILAFSAPWLGGPLEAERSWPDHLALDFIHFFAEMKFYALFSFLFGLGFVLQADRAAARGVDIRPVYRRRLWALLLIGLAHAVLLWSGDILVTYAILGFVMLRFREAAPRRLLRAALICLAAPTILMGLVAFVTLVDPAGGSGDGSVDAVTEWYRRGAIQAYAHGGYLDTVRHRMVELALMCVAGLVVAPHIFAMFMLGLWAGRRGIFHSVETHLPFLRSVLAIGLPVGLALNLLYALGEREARGGGPASLEAIGQAVIFVGATTLSMVYAAGFVLLARRSGAREWLDPLAAVGRMAMTNYMMQTVIATTLFYNYGFGLYNRVGPAAALLIAVAIYAAQVLISVHWLRRFAYGPAEWIWRTMTYGKAPQLRRAA